MSRYPNPNFSWFTCFIYYKKIVIHSLYFSRKYFQLKMTFSARIFKYSKSCTPKTTVSTSFHQDPNQGRSKLKDSWIQISSVRFLTSDSWQFPNVEKKASTDDIPPHPISLFTSTTGWIFPSSSHPPVFYLLKLKNHRFFHTSFWAKSSRKCNNFVF